MNLVHKIPQDVSLQAVNSGLSSDTPILEESTVLQWTGDQPPFSFYQHGFAIKTVKLLDVAIREWAVLPSAIRELASILQCKDSSDACKAGKLKLAWTILTVYKDTPINVIVYRDSLVVAALSKPSEDTWTDFCDFHNAVSEVYAKTPGRKLWWCSYRAAACIVVHDEDFKYRTVSGHAAKVFDFFSCRHNGSIRQRTGLAFDNAYVFHSSHAMYNVKSLQDRSPKFVEDARRKLCNAVGEMSKSIGHSSDDLTRKKIYKLGESLGLPRDSMEELEYHMDSKSSLTQLDAARLLSAALCSKRDVPFLTGKLIEIFNAAGKLK